MRIRRYALLCLAHDSGWGGISRGSARIVATGRMRHPGGGVKPRPGRTSQSFLLTARGATPIFP